jgi:HSP20 family molecular chaperone IbpA
MFNSKHLDPSFKALTNLIINEFNNANNCKDQNTYIEPDTDIFEGKDNYKVLISIPGVKGDNVDVRVDDGVLLRVKTRNKKLNEEDEIKVEYENSQSDQTKESEHREESNSGTNSQQFKYLASQIYEGNYYKEIKFPIQIEEDNIVARLENGILIIILKKKK